MNKVGVVDKMTLKPTNDFTPGTAMNATSTIEISISCRNLVNKDVLSKSDPICIVYQRPSNTKQWSETLRTEILQNNLNPDFATKLTMEYRFEQSQNVRFEVYDIDSPTSILGDQDGIGYVECTVANIVSAGPKGFTQELLSLDQDHTTTGSKSSNGTIILTAEELASLKDEVHLQITGHGMGSCMTCFMPKSFYTLSRINDAHNFVIVHRCNEVRGSNPLWPPLTISGRSLCNGDKDRQLKIEVNRLNFKEEDEFIGSALTSLNRMAGAMDGSLQLTSRTGMPTKSTVSILSCSITPVFTFLDFIQAGTRIHLCFSIDFTSSNGDPTQATSLHHISKDPRITNPYEQAIEATGQIIKDYDNTNIFPVYGFGARIPPKGATSHDFPVTLASTPNCKGISGVIRAYRQCISRIQLFGPTNFAPVINRVAEIASKTKPGQHYYVLVILTDGVITDMAQTKEAIVKAAVFPISIIIVGVGESDFTSMEELDGDEGTVSYMGRFAERDIVQFVSYRSAESWLHRTGEETVNTIPITVAMPTAPQPDGLTGTVTQARREMTNLMAQGQLAEEVLAEIPEQLTGYMKARGIIPSMVTKEDDIHADEVFPDGPEMPNTEKSKKLQAEREEAEKLRAKREEDERRRQEEEEEKKRKKLSIWNIFALIARGRKKFKPQAPVVTTNPIPELHQPLTEAITQQPLTDATQP